MSASSTVDTMKVLMEGLVVQSKYDAFEGWLRTRVDYEAFRSCCVHCSIKNDDPSVQAFPGFYKELAARLIDLGIDLRQLSFYLQLASETYQPPEGESVKYRPGDWRVDYESGQPTFDHTSMYCSVTGNILLAVVRVLMK